MTKRDSLAKDSKGRITIAEFLHPMRTPKEGYSDVILKIPLYIYDQVQTYLTSAGLDGDEGIVELLEFGLGIHDAKKFGELKEENAQLSGKASKSRISKLDAYENFLENKALAAGLASGCSENNLLSRKMLASGLLDTTESTKVRQLEEAARHFLAKYTFQARL